ncbi:phage portal protein [Rhodoplanes sp. Z2-YC6860]|uniref:phage portal protein n=1 Tax=Rhodoplanes sp. Z2-YC6860 TaxID=674703 RepID=UPI0018DB4BA3|nr:phage portal protein [Rhodoplanes sp. Z2-YC6860]
MQLWPFRAERKSTTTGREALVDYAVRTSSDIAVSPERALRCPAVFAGVRVRCEVLGTLPIVLYKRRNDDGKERAADHPLYRLLHDRPNGWTSAAQFVMELEHDAIMHGAGYALANRNGERIVELIRLHPHAVTEEIDRATLEPAYRVTAAGGQRTYSWRDILHVPTIVGTSMPLPSTALPSANAAKRLASPSQ